MNHVKAAIGILIKEHKVYITKGKNVKNIWEFPGGKVKQHENIIHGLKRELWEEIGIVVLQCRFLTYVKHIEFKKK